MSNDAWNAMSPQAKKIAVENAIAAQLEQMRVSNREPDVWEKVQLADALDSLRRRFVWLAATCTALALTPPSERAPEHEARYRKLVSDISLDSLSRGLAYVRGMPA